MPSPMSIAYPWTIATTNGLVRNGPPADQWRPLWKNREGAEAYAALVQDRSLFAVPLPEYGDRRD